MSPARAHFWELLRAPGPEWGDGPGDIHRTRKVSEWGHRRGRTGVIDTVILSSPRDVHQLFDACFELYMNGYQ